MQIIPPEEQEQWVADTKYQVDEVVDALSWGLYDEAVTALEAFDYTPEEFFRIADYLEKQFNYRFGFGYEDIAKLTALYYEEEK